MKKLGSIASWILAFGGVISSFYFYFKNVKERVPTFIVSPIKPILVDSHLLRDRTFKIFDDRGKEILENVYVITFYFFNQGKESVKKENILAPIKINISKGARILNHKILKESRKLCRFQLINNDSIQGTIEIDFKIMERLDGFTGQIIYSGDSGSDLTIEENSIEGVKEIANKYSTPPEDLILIYGFLSCLAFVCFLFIFIIVKINITTENKKSLREILNTKYQLVVRNEEHLAEKSTISFTYLKLLIISTSAFLLIFISSLILSKTLLFELFNPKQIPGIEIPANILP